MKFPRTAKVLGSQSDAAPYAAVFFLLVILLLLGAFLPIPGLNLALQPPGAADLPGLEQASVAVAVDISNQLYFANQLVTTTQLTAALSNAMRQSRTPLTLVIHADKAVSYDELMQLTLLARGIGITNVWLATLPRAADVSPQP